MQILTPEDYLVFDRKTLGHVTKRRLCKYKYRQILWWHRCLIHWIICFWADSTLEHILAYVVQQVLITSNLPNK